MKNRMALILLVLGVLAALGWGLKEIFDPWPRNKTLVVLLNKYPETSQDISGVKVWLANDLAPIERMSFGRELLNITYAGPYVGPIEDCSGDGGSAIIRYGANRAHRAGINVSEYNYLVVLRNGDFGIDPNCSNPGNGWYIEPWQPSPYEGGLLKAIGISTIVTAARFDLPSGPQDSFRTLHEFLHGYGRGTQHTLNLKCFSDYGHKIRTSYYYLGDEDILQSSFCKIGNRSSIDVMGMPGGRTGVVHLGSPVYVWSNDYLEVNSILKMQYKWLTPSHIATMEAAALSVGRVFTLRPIETAAAANEIQMIKIPIPGTKKAYALELRGGPAVSGMGVYLYLMPNRHFPEYQRQYLLFTGDVWSWGEQTRWEAPAPMRLGETIIDTRMNLRVTITSVSSEEASVRVFIGP